MQERFNNTLLNLEFSIQVLDILKLFTCCPEDVSKCQKFKS